MNNSLPIEFLQFDNFPDSAYVGTEIFSLLSGMSRTTIWRGIKEGNLPKPIKMSERKVAFNVGDIRLFLKERSQL